MTRRRACALLLLGGAVAAVGCSVPCRITPASMFACAGGVCARHEAEIRCTKEFTIWPSFVATGEHRIQLAAWPMDDRGRSRLVLVDPAGGGSVSARDFPREAEQPVVVGDAGGSLHFLDTPHKSHVNQAIDFAPSDGDFRSEIVDQDKYQARFRSAAFGNNGTLYAAMTREYGAAILATRTREGVWSKTELRARQVNTVPGLGLSIDAAGVPYVAYLAADDSRDFYVVAYHQGTGPRIVAQRRPQPWGLITHIRVASPLPGDAPHAPVIVFDKDSSILVEVPSAASSAEHGYRELSVPGIVPANDCKRPAALGVAAQEVGHPCPTTIRCTEKGDTVLGHKLARTADGALWLVFMLWRVDRDVVWRTHEPEISEVRTLGYCGADTIAERSFAELVVMRVVTGADARLEEAYHTPIARRQAESTPGMDMAAEGSSLHLFLGTGTEEDPIHYLVLDARELERAIRLKAPEPAKQVPPAGP